MNMQETIVALNNKAASSKCANAVFHAFALRQRARQQVTLVALMAKMENEGFKFKVSEYQDVLKFLGDLGLGTLAFGAKGQIRALTQVKITLQSIGEAAIGSRTKFDSFKQRAKFKKLSTKERIVAATSPAQVERRQPPAGATAGVRLSVTAIINGKPVTMWVPDEFNKNEIAELVGRFRGKGV